MQPHANSKTAPQQVATVTPLQVRGRFFTAIALHLTGRPDRGFLDLLDERLKQTPQFFDNAPVVVDIEHAKGLETADELARLTGRLRDRRLALFAIQGGTPAQAAAAAEAGLISLSGGRDAPVDRVTRQGARAVATPPPREAPPPVTKVITQPVRSGQTVFADRGDLIVVGPVSSGAEVIATGNIHIYGRLRGRALAGVNGDTSARIFCHELDAELIAIAGLYRTSETLESGTPREYVQVYLEGDRLNVESLK